MIDYLKHNDYEEIFADNSIDELFDCLDIDGLIMLYFYGSLLIDLLDKD